MNAWSPDFSFPLSPGLPNELRAQRATAWKLKSRQLDFSHGPAVMGILNVTPDSFSDGGEYSDSRSAIEQGLRLVEAGAQIIDIGGESTRPYSAPITESEELRRVIPVIEKLSDSISVPISIDTSKASVAKEAISAGAEIINDVTGLEGDPKMLGVASESGAGICVMHMQGTPQTMQDAPGYGDVVSEIHDYLKSRREVLVQAGIERARICVDPGIGFGKEHHHNLTLAQQAWQFIDLGPVLIGHSRKGFIAKLLGDKNRNRDAATAGMALSFAQQGIQVIRVHNVQATTDTLIGYASST